MPVISEDQYLLLKFIGKEGKTLKEVSDFQPLGHIWDYKNIPKMLGDFEWANLVEDDKETNFIKLNAFGIAAIKKYRKVKRLNDVESFPKRYWPLTNFLAWLIGIGTAILVDKCKLQTPAQTKKEPIKQSVSNTKKVKDSSALH